MASHSGCGLVGVVHNGSSGILINCHNKCFPWESGSRKLICVHMNCVCKLLLTSIQCSGQLSISLPLMTGPKDCAPGPHNNEGSVSLAWLDSFSVMVHCPAGHLTKICAAKAVPLLKQTGYN